MTGPTRPTYRVTVTNVDQGWTKTVTQGDEAPTRADATLELVDDFSMGWCLEGDQIPTKFAADTVNLRFWARTTEHVPMLEVGDVLTVDLDRPGPDDDLIPYMHFAGRMSDPTATTIPGYGIDIAVTAIGFDADLSDDVTLGNDPSTSYATEGYLMGLVHDQAGVSSATHTPGLFTRQVRPWGDMSAQQAVDRLLAGAGDATRAAVLRYAYKWLPFNPALPNDGAPAGWIGYEGDNGDVVFYLQKWLQQLPAPLTLVPASSDPDMITLGPDAATVDQVTTLSATLCEVPAEWSKSRADIVNVATVVYSVDNGSGKLVDGKSTVANSASRARYGPQPREVETFVTAGSVAGVAASVLNPTPGSLAWSIPGLTVNTHLMDDEELDQLAPIFYPHAMPIASVAGRFIILTDLDEDTAIAGDAVALQLVGATFTISRGRLVITPSVRAVAQPDFATSITWADLAAGPYADITWTDAGAHYIDPSLDWDELAYSDA